MCSKSIKQQILLAVIALLALPEDWDFGSDSDIQYTVHECGDLVKSAIFVTVSSARNCDTLPPDVTQYDWVGGKLINRNELCIE